jgi:hypothetical protein
MFNIQLELSPKRDAKIDKNCPSDRHMTFSAGQIERICCPDCGAAMVRLGNCFTCPICGYGGCG